MSVRSIGKRGIGLFDIFNVTFFFVISLIMIFPFWNVLVTSLVTGQEYSQSILLLFPKKITFSSYIQVFQTASLYRSFFVTVGLTIVGTIYSMLLTVTMGYAMSKKDLPGKGIIAKYVIFTMYFSGGLIPFFLWMKTLNLLNTPFVLFIPVAINTFNLMICISFFRQLPDSLEDSAKIDGANDLVILFRLVLPLSAPVIATLSLFYAVYYWNSWTDVLYYCSANKAWYTLQFTIRSMIKKNQMSEQLAGGDDGLFTTGIQMAAVIVSIIPILCVYPFLQKYFTKGVMLGAVKG
jgi:putative aldouronate transport system permease protein